MTGIATQAIGVSIKNLSKVFLSPDKKSQTIAVDHINLEIRPGTLVTLLGPSGCGKTTILRMLAGFTSPTQGSIYLGGIDMTNTPPNKRDVGMMFQSYALFPHLSVFENVAYGLRVKHLPKKEITDRVTAVLDLMRILEFQDRIPEQLSGGQQQRVALARAIVTEPKILLFDEPLSNLDAKMREYMREELRKIQKKLSITSIYVTHDQVEAMAISDEVVIMNHGRIEQIGTPNDIYVRPANKFVADFMGKANFIEGKVISLDEEYAYVDALNHKIPVSNFDIEKVKPGSEVSIMARPEFIRIQKDGFISGLVQRATFFGQYMEYDVNVDDKILLINDFNFIENGFFDIGEQINLNLSANHLRILMN